MGRRPIVLFVTKAVGIGDFSLEYDDAKAIVSYQNEK